MLIERERIKKEVEKPAPDYLPLEVMEAQLLKLGDIIQKKEKEITHMQMVIQQVCLSLVDRSAILAPSKTL